MNNFFTSPFSQQDLQQRLAERRSQHGAQRSMSMSMGPAIQEDGSVSMEPSIQDGDEPMDMIGGTLDEIIHNNKEMQRRQSISGPYIDEQELNRRTSMMEFGATQNGLNGFQFAPSSGIDDPNLRQQSTGRLDMSGYTDLGSGMNLQASPMGYTSSMQAGEPMTIDTSGFPMSADMVQDMMGYTPYGMASLPEEDSAMNMFSQQNFPPYGSKIDSNTPYFMMSGNDQNGLPSHQSNIQGNSPDHDMMPSLSGSGAPSGNMITSPVSMNMNLNIGNSIASYSSSTETPGSQPTRTREPSFGAPAASPSPVGQEPEVLHVPKPEPEPSQYKNIYSQSGFDMLGALIKVASRKNPEINIGKVDMSCAFVVCDISQPDCPIIYVSDIFERLTGYTKYEVLGRNCRFLQSPEGKVQAGVRREFVDNNSIYYLRNRISEKKEAQRSLINYRKGGQPFMNLLTMIPITGEDDKEIKYYVGFQVDLVEKPTSVEGKSINGMYTVDYSQGSLPQYTWQPPEGLKSSSDGGQTISRDDVSAVLGSINSTTESELTKRMWDKVLLENTDDVVHVLSLKGLFLYLSPSCRKVLEYDAAELTGSGLSSVCHPSDIVPVTRELKDTTVGVPVSVVFRIRRKKSGYTWFESHGTLCVEPGKGRKCIILVGRERPVYALSRHDFDAAGALGKVRCGRNFRLPACSYMCRQMCELYLIGHRMISWERAYRLSCVRTPKPTLVVRWKRQEQENE